ncbi:hypothetical protein CF645_38420, partial [Burkholderia pseudomallei]|uniref:hypothetical protein n=1 Tax=Burkholderia pseudomallei TaxID=28450 RepID=UPI000CCE3156
VAARRAATLRGASAVLDDIRRTRYRHRHLRRRHLGPSIPEVDTGGGVDGRSERRSRAELVGQLGGRLRVRCAA